MAKWWQEQIVYQIYPRSFQDSNGDGIGDIPGIISRLDELKNLGVGILWLSPVYSSPNADNGYDISDYRNINPAYGTMADMDELILQCRRRGLRLIMDLVVNHTSDEHKWFQSSRDKDSPYRNYYIWRPGRPDGSPPNNWTSFFAEDCWEYDPKSGEYYLHLFAKKQPDLNYQNPEVIEEVKEIIRFWLDKGISGFRCDVINILFKESLKDGKKKLALTGSEHYISREGTHAILRRLKSEVLNNYDCFTVGETVFVTPKMGRELCDKARGELDMIFSFEHMETDQLFVKWFKKKFRSRPFALSLAKWQNALEWPAVYLENHDQPRSVSRFGNDQKYWKESAKMLAVLLLTLRGTPFLYQGEEIGMTNFDYTSMDEIQDVESHNVYALAKKLHIPSWYRWRMMRLVSRDNARTPMQWDASENAGFTSGKPWLAVNHNFISVNYQDEKNDPDSILNFYREMILLRQSSSPLKFGKFKAFCITDKIFAYGRKYKGQTVFICLNMSDRYTDADICRVTDKRCSGLSSQNILISSYSGVTETTEGRHTADTCPIGNKIYKLRPYEAVVFTDGNRDADMKQEGFQ